MIAAGLCDAAVVGGANSLCLTTLYGFHSLALNAPGPCRPFDVARDGISIAEAAGFVLLERPAPRDAGRPLLAMARATTRTTCRRRTPRAPAPGWRWNAR